MVDIERDKRKLGQKMEVVQLKMDRCKERGEKVI